jgi:hypothetical protein
MLKIMMISPRDGVSLGILSYKHANANTSY